MTIIDKSIQSNFESGPISKYLFKNGATFLHLRSPLRRTAYFSLWINVGSRHETPQNQGICHVLEHMLFKDYPKESSEKKIQQIEALGGEVNAFTSKEYTCFEVSCLKRKMPSVLPLFLELVLTPQFDEAELEREKKVICQELREDWDDFELLAEEKLLEKMFDFPLGHSIGGTISSVKKIKVPILKRFFKKYFIPPRMVFSLVVDEGPEPYFPILENLFKKVVSYKDAKPYRPKLLKKGKSLPPSQTILRRRTDITTLVFGLPAGPVEDPFRAAFRVLDVYLTDGMTSRLFLELREKTGLVYGVSSDIANFSDAGCLMISANCLKSSIPKVKKVIHDTLVELSKEGIPETELNKIKEVTLDAWEQSFDDMEDVNHHMGRSEVMRSKVLSFEDLKQEILSVKNEDIKKICHNILKKNYSLVVVTNQGK